jgi:Family of unknown function (DUF6510)
MMENKLDGNAASGTLQEIFPFDMTITQVTCMGCDSVGVFGTMAAYINAMGTVIRCPICDTVIMRAVHAKGRYWFEMSGTRVLQIPMEQ